MNIWNIAQFSTTYLPVLHFTVETVLVFRRPYQTNFKNLLGMKLATDVTLPFLSVADSDIFV